MSSNAAIRAIAYIDGFNLYHGLRDSKFQRFYWLDMTALARLLLLPNQTLVKTKYFTARIAGPKPVDSPQKADAINQRRKRQTLYLDALATLPDFKMYEGHYLPKEMKCRACGAGWTSHEEKMTDVNIATELLADAFTDAFDLALLISADSDLAPPIRAIRTHFPHKRVVAVFPPKRQSNQLRRFAHAQLTIGHGTLAKCQLPDTVTTPSGYQLHRPDCWR